MSSVEIFKKIDCSLNEALYPIENKEVKDGGFSFILFCVGILSLIMLYYGVNGLIGLINRKEEVDLSMLFLISPLIFILTLIRNNELEQEKEKREEKRKRLEERKKYEINKFKTDKTVIDVLFAIKGKLTSEEYNKIYSFIEEKNGFELPFITFQQEVIKSEKEAIKNEQEKLRKENMVKKKLLLDISYENDK